MAARSVAGACAGAVHVVEGEMVGVLPVLLELPEGTDVSTIACVGSNKGAVGASVFTVTGVEVEMPDGD